MSNGKRCCRCGETKPAECFTKRATGKAGLRPYCRACRTLMTKACRHANPEKHNAIARAWRKLNPDKVRSAVKKWNAANPDRVRATAKAFFALNPDYQKSWQRANPDKTARYAKVYGASNPDKVSALRQRRRARLAGAPGRGVSPEQWQEIRELANGRCTYCFKFCSTFHMDHIEPLASGGAHDPDNIAAACARCNMSKHAKSLLVWLAKAG